MTTSTTPPLLTPLPPAPLPTDAEAVFDAKAGASLTAQAVMVGEVNTALGWQADSMAASLGYKDAAAGSAVAAAGSAAASASKVSLAADQVALATTAKVAAQAAQDSAETAAQAASAGAGFPAFVDGLDVLQIKPDKSGVKWGKVGQAVGDTLVTMRAPDATYLPADRTSYLKSAYPELSALLGNVTDMDRTSVASVQSMPNGTGLNYLAYGNGVLVGASGTTLFRTVDGLNWTQLNYASIAITQIAFFKGSFLAFTASQTYYTSVDGVVWLTKTSSALNANGVYVARANSQILVAMSQIGPGYGYATTSDGVNFVSRAAAPITVSKIVVANDIFFLTGGNYSSSATSVDGISWVYRGRNVMFDVILFCNGVYYATSNFNTYIYYSSDPYSLNWSRFVEPYYDISQNTPNFTAGFVAGSTICFTGQYTTYVSYDSGSSWVVRSPVGAPVVDAGILAFGKYIWIYSSYSYSYEYQWPLYSYDSSAQFITPRISAAPAQLRTYIKAKSL